VSQGRASPEDLEEEEATLGEMSTQLEQLRSSYDTLWGQASGVLKNLTGSPSGSGVAAAGGGTGAAASSPAGGSGSTKAAPPAAGSGAKGAVAAGLRFSGLAMRITQDIASAVKADAERMFKDMESEAEARRRRKAADAAFLEMLRAAAPPVTHTSTWEAAEAQLAGDARWGGVGDAGRRRELFDAYVAAAAQVEAQRVSRGQDALADLLRRLNPEPGTSWEEVRAVRGSRDERAGARAARRPGIRQRGESLRGSFRHPFQPRPRRHPPPNPTRQIGSIVEVEPACAALTPAEREAAFVEYMRKAKLERALAAAAERADNAFRGLLFDADPPITAASTWPAVKPQLWRDGRYMALEEPRRLALFEEYVGALREQARAAEAEERARAEAAAAAAAAALAAQQAALQNAAAAAASARRPASPAAPDGPDSIVLTAGELGLTDEAFDALGAEDLAQLRLLRWEQEKLRQQYALMEEKLREMEGRLSRSASAAPSPAAASPAALSRAGSPTGNARREDKKDGILFVFEDEEAEAAVAAAAGAPGSNGAAE
jgi:hypothetical protein